MSRHGFALLSALWIVVALGTLGAVATRVGRSEFAAARNRVLLARAGWAREACVELLLARFQPTDPLRGDSAGLGRGTWCRIAVEDPEARLNVNVASPDHLSALLGSDSLTAALLDWRDPDSLPRPGGAEADWYRARGRATPRNGPLADLRELRLVRGFDLPVVRRLLPLLTTRGDGRVDVNTAPGPVLSAVGLPSDAVAAVLWRRTAGRPIRDLGDLLATLPPSSRPVAAAAWQASEAGLAFSPGELWAVAEGGVAGTPIRASARLLLVPLPDRVAIVARMTE